MFNFSSFANTVASFFPVSLFILTKGVFPIRPIALFFIFRGLMSKIELDKIQTVEKQLNPESESDLSMDS